MHTSNSLTVQLESLLLQIQMQIIARGRWTILILNIDITLSQIDSIQSSVNKETGGLDQINIIVIVVKIKDIERSREFDCQSMEKKYYSDK